MTRPVAPIRILYPLLFALIGVFLLGALLVGTQPIRSARPSPVGAVRFAVIGDYGDAGTPERDVATLVHSWTPDFVLTVGDNSYYTSSPTATQTITQAIDTNIGQYYHDYIYPYTGIYGPGAPSNQFWPAMGNHDWSGSTNPHPYVDYFTLPGNERYYELLQGPVQFFMIDSDNREPDGITMTSTQALWLQGRLAASTAPWKLVILHHAPYSSIAATTALRWPYQQWGASAVLAGHIHCYERFDFSGFPYFVDGLGGAGITTANFNPQPGSVVRYKADYGAMLIEATSTSITFQFYTRIGVLIDTYTMNLGAPSPTTTRTGTPPATATRTASPVASSTRTPTGLPATATRTPTTPPGTPTETPRPPTATGTPGAASPTSGPPVPTTTRTATPAATACALVFADVPSGSPFYDYVRCLACRGIVGGYPCGGTSEPCPGTYFRPNALVTRGQIAKIIAGAAQFVEPVPSTQWTFEDVAPGSTFHLWIERLAGRGIIGGYPCGNPGEPCIGPGNRPYFRPNNNVTRGQLSKITGGAAGWTATPTGQTFEDVPPGSTFYPYVEQVAGHGVVSGYPCGGPGEPCVLPGNRGYFRPNQDATRGQMSKIAAQAFFPNCQTPVR